MHLKMSQFQYFQKHASDVKMTLIKFVVLVNWTSFLINQFFCQMTISRAMSIIRFIKKAFLGLLEAFLDFTFRIQICSAQSVVLGDEIFVFWYYNNSPWLPQEKLNKIEIHVLQPGRIVACKIEIFCTSWIFAHRRHNHCSWGPPVLNGSK
jgi:hypothetical protein